MNDTADRPKGRSLGPLRALLPYIRPYTGTLYMAMAALLLASAAQLTLPVAIRYLIDAGLMAADAPRSASLFRSMGHTVTEVDISEFEKLEGCVTCLSVRIRS